MIKALIEIGRSVRGVYGTEHSLTGRCVNHAKG